jgi:hypothetical protein
VTGLVLPAARWIYMLGVGVSTSALWSSARQQSEKLTGDGDWRSHSDSGYRCQNEDPIPMSPDATRVLRDRRDELKTALAELGDLRPGSLVERYRRCGKPNCRCAAEGVAGHGRVGR